jgi:hypothetical protein
MAINCQQATLLRSSCNYFLTPCIDSEREYQQEEGYRETAPNEKGRTQPHVPLALCKSAVGKKTSAGHSAQNNNIQNCDPSTSSGWFFLFRPSVKNPPTGQANKIEEKGGSGEKEKRTTDGRGSRGERRGHCKRTSSRPAPIAPGTFGAPSCPRGKGTIASFSQSSPSSSRTCCLPLSLSLSLSLDRALPRRRLRQGTKTKNDIVRELWPIKDFHPDWSANEAETIESPQLQSPWIEQ